MGLHAIGVSGKPVSPKSGTIFALKAASGLTWGKRFGTRGQAEAEKRNFFDVRMAQYKADPSLGADEKFLLDYDVSVVEVPSDEHDIVFSLTGEWRWTGDFDAEGRKLYRIKIAGITE